VSIWGRLKRAIQSRQAAEGDPPATDAELGQAPPEAPVGAPPEPSTQDDIETQFSALAQSAAPDDALALTMFEELSRKGFEARALDIGVRILETHPGLAGFRLRLGHSFTARGDDARARRTLEPLLAVSTPPIEAVASLAEIAERAGDAKQAATLYERVLALDVAYPNAQERLERLREASAGSAPMAGVTLMASGATAGGKYQIIRELGRGGAGTVFAAEDTSLKRRVALKIYHRRTGRELDRLRHEARLPAKIEHPGVIRIFDLDEKIGAIAMEWAFAGSLKARVARGDWSADQLCGCLKSVAQTLITLHEEGIIHRDIKPSNILLRTATEPVLTDFGLALGIGDEPERIGDVGEGTVGFMPPEQRMGARAAIAADTYALAATAMELFRSGKVGMPDPLQLALGHALAEDAAARPSMRDLASAFGSTPNN